MSANPHWPTEAPIELLVATDAEVAAWANAYDSVFGSLLGVPGCGDMFRDLWRSIRPQPTCDCPMDPHHRWNCTLTPIWAQTIRELDCNPWTVIRPRDLDLNLFQLAQEPW